MSQIYHILIKSIFSNFVLDVRYFCGADCGSDYFQVVWKLKIEENRETNGFLWYSETT